MCIAYNENEQAMDNWLQFGVISYSRSHCDQDNTKSEAKYPTYYTNVGYFSRWIKEYGVNMQYVLD